MQTSQRETITNYLEVTKVQIRIFGHRMEKETILDTLQTKMHSNTESKLKLKENVSAASLQAGLLKFCYPKYLLE